MTVKQAVDRERAASPMHRLAAALFRTATANLKAEDYGGSVERWPWALAIVRIASALAAGLSRPFPAGMSRWPQQAFARDRAWLPAPVHPPARLANSTASTAAPRSPSMARVLTTSPRRVAVIVSASVALS